MSDKPSQDASDDTPEKLAAMARLADTVTDLPAAAIHQALGAGYVAHHGEEVQRADDAAEVSRQLAEMTAERDHALTMVAKREDILHIVAHDLRNPLNLVKVSGSLLGRMVRGGGDGGRAGNEALDPVRVKEIADSLAVAVRRMERLISDLLDLDALDKGQLRLVRGPANACQVVEEVLAEMQPRAAEKDVAIVGDLPRRAVIIDCDRDRIAQILENLIANAIRFTPKDKRIVVRLTEHKGEARFEVADEGPGIADEDLPRIFDPFYRAKVAQGRGLGLGLSIALDLVRAHNGAIWAESAAGHGATFVFTMPRREVRRDTRVEMRVVPQTLLTDKRDKG